MTWASGSAASTLPGSESFAPRMPAPTIADGSAATRASMSRAQSSGRPIGVMPPYSMPVSATASSIGAKLARRAPSSRRTVPLTSRRVVASTMHAA